jgi:hypothetical protein
VIVPDKEQNKIYHFTLNSSAYISSTNVVEYEYLTDLLPGTDTYVEDDRLLFSTKHDNKNYGAVYQLTKNNGKYTLL